ncbi:MAG TPA: SBBP repeat-containing protein [Saprospiraceae bacterium]|nr:SBBP repeat-containing protein [Saprospiraceae bacterium]
MVTKILKYSIISFFLFPIFSYSQSTHFSWIKQFGDSGSDAGNCVLVDASGDLLTCGFFRGKVDFDPNEAMSILTSAGSEDIFVSKINSEGQLLWAKRMGGKEADRGNQITSDLNGNIYLTGNFKDVVDFESGMPNSKLTSYGFGDAFVAKLNRNGQLIWVKQIGGNLDDVGKSISLDQFGNILVTGHFQGTTDFDPGLNVQPMTSLGSFDVFMLKLDPDGNFIWVRQIGGRLDDMATAITLDLNGNVVVSGNFKDTVDFNPGTDIYILKDSGAGNVFVLKLNAEGEFIWAKSTDGQNIVFSIGMAIDQTGNIFTTGFFRSEADFDPGPDIFKLTAPGIGGDVFISKLDSDGNLIWVKQFSGPAHDVGLGICLDQQGNVYTTGCYQELVDFDPGPEVFNLYSSNQNNNDIFITKLNPEGNFQWARSMNGPASDIGFSIAVDKDWNVFTTGVFGSTLNANPGPDSILITSKGAEDVFLLKITQSSVGVLDNMDHTHFSIYPIPVTDVLTLNWIAENEEEIHLMLHDLNGKEIYKIRTSGHSGNNEFSMEARHLPPGIYFVSILQSEKIIRKKIMLE